MAKRIGLLTGGGDAPGLNFCLKTVVNNAIDQGYEVVGIRKGWEGLINYDPEEPVTHTDNAMLLTKPKVRDIDRTSGSFLHSSRINPAQVRPKDAPAFLRVRGNEDQPLDLTNHLKRVIDNLQLEALLVVGDNNTLSYAAHLNKEGIPIVGIPKSVHNDVRGTMYSLGFSTAIGRGVEFVHEIRDVAASREEIAVISIAGQGSGLATMVISMFAGVDRTLIPEVPFDPSPLVDLLIQDKRLNPSNYAILTLSEGAAIAPQVAGQYDQELSAEGDQTVWVPDRGAKITGLLEKIADQRILVQPLSYLVRTGRPDGWDLVAATNFANLAVDLIAAGNTGRVVVFRPFGRGPGDEPLEVTTQPPEVDLTTFYNADTFTVKPDMFRAARVAALNENGTSQS